MASKTGTLMALFFFLFLARHVFNVDGEDVCEDRLSNCGQYNIGTCKLYNLWATENCAKYCGICIDKVQQECPAGWSFFKADQTCIKIYGDVLGHRQPWHASSSICQTLGGGLVEIRNKEKTFFLLDLLKGNQCMWIGLRNVAPKGFRFKFGNGSYLGPHDYHPWLPNNPDDYRGNEKCVCMHPKGDSDGQWNDLSCRTSLPYACSIRPKTTTDTVL